MAKNKEILKKREVLPNNNMQRKAIHMESFSGPLPHPEILTKYADIIPNGADRILRMAEQQQAHRQYLEKVVVESDAKRANLGLVLGFITVVVLGIGGVVLISLERNIDGLAVIFVPLGSLAALFIYAQKSRKKEREAKNMIANDRNQKNAND